MGSMSIDWWHFAAFIIVSFASGFGVARFIRNGQGPRDDASPVRKGEAWSTATTRPIDFGTRTIGARADDTTHVFVRETGRVKS